MTVLIYSHKPQRSGRGISSNTNNPPQDPPSPHEEKQIPIPIEIQHKIIQTVPEKIIREPEKLTQEVPDIPIEDTTPPVPEVCPEEKPFTPKATLIIESIPETKPKVDVTAEIKIKKQPKPEQKISWFKRFISAIKKFFRRE